MKIVHMGTVVEVPDVITHANFVSGVFVGAGVKFPTFPLTYTVVLTTVILLCQRPLRIQTFALAST